MAKLYNLARMSTATVGAGTITLGSAVSGYLTFALAGVANAEIVSYGIKDGSNSEVGTGTYTSAGTTLTRNVTASTNGNAAISLSGSAEVFITARAEDLVSQVLPQGRITLTSGTPIMISNVAAATTVFYTAGIMPIFDGSTFSPVLFPEVSQATTDATKSPAAVANNSLYDLFAWMDGTTPRVTRGPAWTNTTTRSAGTALVLVNGIYLNNASITNGPAASRGTYVGTIASNGTATIDWIFGGAGAGGVAGLLMIWNAYNRELFSSFSGDTAASWTYATSNTWRAANNSSTIRTTIVRGLNVGEVEAKYSAVGNPNTTATVNIYCGIGLDSTTAVSGTSGYIQSPGATAVPFQCSGEYSGAPSAGGYTGIGQHYLSAVESQNFTTTTTWFGFASGAYQTGITVKTWQ